MKIAVPDYFANPLPRRDIVAICTYLNRTKRSSVDARSPAGGVFIEKVADAARMQ